MSAISKKGAFDLNELWQKLAAGEGYQEIVKVGDVLKALSDDDTGKPQFLNGARPNPALYAVGFEIYNLTTLSPNYSDGVSFWLDAMGLPVI